MLFSKGIDLQPGDVAPDFVLEDESGVEHRLSDFQGQPVVVYFYPKDDTPGCKCPFGATRPGLTSTSERPPA